MSNLTSLKEITRGELWVGFGIAGNQAGHLNQAGETDDFMNVAVEENVPKGMFPWFLPGSAQLGNNPLSSTKVQLRGETRIQLEPEIGLVVEFHYSDSLTPPLEGMTVRGFTVFNDLSRRVTAEKISHKKNWGADSQGIAEQVLPLTDFNEVGGQIDRFRLCCFLRREGVLYDYGEDTSVSEYCYFNGKLVEWMVDQFNTQEDFGPLEKLSEMLVPGKPPYGVIGIGATRYTEFGKSEERFLRAGDESIVIAYDGEAHNYTELKARLEKMEELPSSESLFILMQSVS